MTVGRFFLLFLSFVMIKAYSEPTKPSKITSNYVGYCCVQKDHPCLGLEKDKVQQILDCQDLRRFYIDYGQCKLNCPLNK